MPLNNAPALVAGGTIGPMRLVKLSTVADHTVLLATDGSGSHGDPCIGVTQVGMKRPPGLAGSDTTVAAEAGDNVQVFSLGDVAPVVCGAAVTRGSPVKADANGAAITASSTGDYVAGVALENGAGAGSIIQIVIQAWKF